MYPSVRSGPLGPPPRPPKRAEPWREQVSGNVFALGMTSFFTDISSEMVTAILPLYLTFQLGYSPLQFGAFDGLYQGVVALAAVASGIGADRRRRHKELASIGYGVSAACKLGLVASMNAWGLTTIFSYLDRAGKGIRTAPRDTLISLSAAQGRLGEAFGVHRALDTAGALIGPVVAFALLARVPGAYDTVFVWSFLIALVGLAVLVLFVRNQPVATGDKKLAASWRSMLELLALPRFRAVVLAGSLLGVSTLSSSFVYLTYQRRAGLDLELFPLLFVGAALVYLVLAVPLGRLADRIGRTRVFLGGHLLLLATYAVMLPSELGAVNLVPLFLFFGGFFAATDGVLAALCSAALPEAMRTSGLALLNSLVAVAKVLAAVGFGALWSRLGLTTALALLAGCLAATIPAAAFVLSRRTKGAPT